MSITLWPCSLSCSRDAFHVGQEVTLERQTHLCERLQRAAQGVFYIRGILIALGSVVFSRGKAFGFPCFTALICN